MGSEGKRLLFIHLPCMGSSLNWMSLMRYLMSKGCNEALEWVWLGWGVVGVRVPPDVIKEKSDPLNELTFVLR